MSRTTPPSRCSAVSRLKPGSYTDDTPRGANAGSAYVFRLPELDPGFNRLTAEHLDGGVVRLTYLGLAGTNYALDRAFDLTPSALWEPQATNPAPADGCLIITNTAGPSPSVFWRMRQGP